MAVHEVDLVDGVILPHPTLSFRVLNVAMTEEEVAAMVDRIKTYMGEGHIVWKQRPKGIDGMPGCYGMELAFSPDLSPKTILRLMNNMGG